MQTLTTTSRTMPAPGFLILSVATMIPASLAALSDVRTARLPNRLVALAAFPALLLLFVEMMRGHAGAAAYIVGGSALMALPLLAIHVVSPKAMGFGDVKLAAAVGLALGTVDPRLTVVAICVASAVTGMIGMVTRRTSLPFGPGLVVGTTIAWAAGGLIGMELMPWR